MLTNDENVQASLLRSATREGDLAIAEVGSVGREVSAMLPPLAGSYLKSRVFTAIASMWRSGTKMSRVLGPLGGRPRGSMPGPP